MTETRLVNVWELRSEQLKSRELSSEEEQTVHTRLKKWGVCWSVCLLTLKDLASIFLAGSDPL